MKTSKQNKVLQKRNTKPNKNTTLYFQIGLIWCLLAVYALLEMQFKTKQLAITEPDSLQSELLTVDIPNVVIKKEESKKEAYKTVKHKVLQNPKPATKPIINLNNVFKDPKLESKSTKISTPISIDSVKVPKKPKDDLPEVFNVNLVESAPIYRGCEKKTNNAERLKCMNEKLNKLVQKKFNSEVASELNLKGVHKIYVHFKITKTGTVEFVKAQVPHVKLEKEVLKVVNAIPKMQPAQQLNNKVAVRYVLPIYLDIKLYVIV